MASRSWTLNLHFMCLRCLRLNHSVIGDLGDKLNPFQWSSSLLLNMASFNVALDGHCPFFWCLHSNTICKFADQFNVSIFSIAHVACLCALHALLALLFTKRHKMSTVMMGNNKQCHVKHFKSYLPWQVLPSSDFSYPASQSHLWPSVRSTHWLCSGQGLGTQSSTSKKHTRNFSSGQKYNCKCTCL